MATPRGSTSTNWQELRAQAVPANIKEGFDNYAGELGKSGTRAPFFAVSFYRAVGQVVTGAILDLPDYADWAALLTPYAEDILADDVNKQTGRACLAALQLAVLAASAGWASPAIGDPEPLLGRMRAKIDSETEDYHRSVIWGHLAFGVTDGLRDLIYEDPAEQPPARDGDYGQNVQTIQQQIARVLAQGGDMTSVAAAWAGFRDYFPRLRSGRMATYTDLLFASRAVYTQIGDVPVGDVLARLRDETR